jgi:RHS repeat-associated protein
MNCNPRHCSIWMILSVANPEFPVISYTYDAVGNITQIVNASPTNASSTGTYVYDDLYRLTSANTAYSAPWIPGYSQAYTYDPLGNMLTKTDIGAYVYAATTTPGYANPDAAISIAGGNVAYDNDGNIVSASSTTSSGWSVNGGIWNRRTPITIDHTKVSGSGTLANFPMLFSVTGTEFKTVANGGYVASATGADIFFTSNDGVTKLNHELERYTATAGEVIAWVQVPLLKTSTDTIIYVYYGNATSVTQQAGTAVWDSNYVGVYHLPDGRTTLSATDSTAYVNNGTATNTSALTGKIGGAAKFSGTTTSYISVADSSSLSITSAVTLSGWVYLNGSTFANYTGLIRKGSTSNYFPNNYMLQGIAGTRLVQLVYAHAANNNDWINTSGSIAASGWTYVTGVVDTQNNFRGIYLNGVLDTSSSVTAEAMTTSTDPVWMGKRNDAGFNGYLDEVRISKTARSADWIKTAYNTESSSTFFSLGTASSNVRTITPKTFYTWDYLNRLTKLGIGTTTSTYAYDPWGQRVKMAVATSTTATSYYPTKLYSLSYFNKLSKHIFANGEEIATVSASGANATVTYTHTDHLGGANVVTDSNGTIAELLDYYPYGSARLDQQTSFNEQRKFIGEMYDSASQLSYLNARYYNGTTGKFLSQDPVFWGDPKSQALTNPQSFNTYSYANGNPIVNEDPSGLSWQTFGQGIVSPLTYAYHNPLQTAGVIGVSAAIAVFSPVALAVGGAALGGYAVGSALSHAYFAPNADARDYFLGQGLTAGALTAAGIKGAAGAEGELAGVQANRAAGDAFEAQQFKVFGKSYPGLQSQITVETQSGVKTRIDFMGKSSSGDYCLFECKSSATAPFTKNQSLAFPEIKSSGATIVGRGKPGFPGGTQIPPSAVRILRP